MKRIYKIKIEHPLEFELFQSIALGLGFNWYIYSFFFESYAVLDGGVAQLTDEVKFPITFTFDSDNEILYSRKNDPGIPINFNEFIGLVEVGEIHIN